jgi:hypothetical protein
MRDVPRAKANTLQVSVHVPESWGDEVEQLAETMSKPGLEITKADVMRRALRVGLDALKAEHTEAAKRRRGG